MVSITLAQLVTSEKNDHKTKSLSHHDLEQILEQDCSVSVYLVHGGLLINWVVILMCR